VIVLQILLIEDEPLIQKSLRKLLEKRGASVDTTPSGSEAIELLKRKKYDRVICDLMLSDISGFDVLEESKKVFSSEEISSTFTIITAYSSSHILEKTQKYNCKILTKPFQDINQAINLFLS